MKKYNLFRLAIFLFKKKTSFSVLIRNITVWSVALALTTILITIATYQGFTEAIKKKLRTLAADVEVTQFQIDTSFEYPPISKNFIDTSDLKKNGINSYTFIQKVTVIVSKEEMYGAILRGVSDSFDKKTFSNYIVRGHLSFMEENKNSIVLSQSIADILQVGIRDTLTLYFFEKQLRWRKLIVSGIYETNIEEFDKFFAYCDITFLQKFNRWEEDQVSGVHFTSKKSLDTDSLVHFLDKIAPFDLKISSIQDRFYYFFHWFGILNNSIQLFILIVLSVLSFNIIASMFVLILERMYTIGILKAIGARLIQIRSLFFFSISTILVKGLFLGNLISIVLIYIQKRWKWIPLKKEDYLLDYVALDIGYGTVILTNVFFVFLVLFVFWIATWRISKVSPLPFIQFK